MKALMMYTLLVLAANMAFAAPSDSTTLEVEIIEHKDAVFAVHYQMPADGTIHIKVVDAKTRAFIFAERTTQQKVGIVKYDLSHLPKGQYVIEVRSGTSLATRFIDVQ